MDSQSYLNEISSTVRPEKKPKKNIFSNKFVLVGILFLAALIAMAIIGNIINSNKNGVKEQAFALKLRFESLTSVISEYQTYVKSSDLRSNSASLDGIISNTNRDLSEYIDENYDNKGVDKKLSQTEEERTENLKSELFAAKINGILDRIYAHKMSFEVSLIMSMEGKLYNASSSEELKDILTTSYDSLEILQEKFANFSEAS